MHTIRTSKEITSKIKKNISRDLKIKITEKIEIC